MQPDSRIVTAWWRGGPNWDGGVEIGDAVFEQTTRVAAVARSSVTNACGNNHEGG